MSGDRTSGEQRRNGVRRGDLPRRLGDIITPALDRLAGGDEARAYAAWMRAVGEPVSGGTRPKAFRRGQLTVECASSVWANELTYLGPQILRRMDEVAPGHPVERFRFIVGRVPGSTVATDADAPASDRPRTARDDAGGTSATGRRDVTEPPGGQGSGHSAAKEKCQRRPAAPSAQDGTGITMEGVGDGRLRAAIEAALRPSSEGPPQAPGGGTRSG